MLINIDSVNVSYYTKTDSFNYNIQFRATIPKAGENGCDINGHFELRNGKLISLYSGMLFGADSKQNKELALTIKENVQELVPHILDSQLNIILTKIRN